MSIRMHCVILFHVLLLLLTGCTIPCEVTADFPECPAGSVIAELPLHNPGDPSRGRFYALFPVTIDSKEYMFLIDTGVEISVVDTSLKPYLGKYHNTITTTKTFHFHSIDIYTIKNPLELGPVKLEGYIGCSDFSHHLPEYNVAGLLGQDFLKQFVVQYDFKNNLVRLLNKVPADSDIPHDWGRKIPVIKKDGESLLLINLKLNHELEECFAIDSGNSSLSLLNEDTFDLLAEKFNLEIAVSEDEYKYSYFTLPELCFDIDDTYATINNMSFYKRNSPVTHHLLGMDFLRVFNMVTIDYANRGLYVSVPQKNLTVD